MTSSSIFYKILANIDKETIEEHANINRNSIQPTEKKTPPSDQGKREGPNKGKKQKTHKLHPVNVAPE